MTGMQAAHAQAWERQVKFSLKPFSKGLQGVGQRPTALVAFGKRRRVEKASCGRLFAGVSASAPVGPGRVPQARRTPRRGALVPGGHRSAPTEPPGETSWAGPRPAEDFRKPACPARESVRRPLAQAGGKGKHGASATAPAATAFGVCAACAAFLPPAAPVFKVETF